MSKMRFGLFLVTACLVAGSVSAYATNDPVCLKAARDKRMNCIRDCIDQGSEDAAVCRNIDPACATKCRDDRAVCVAPFIAVLDGCLDDCHTKVVADKALCPPPGDPARDACIDAAQVAAFQCRDTCRENQAVRDGLKGCCKVFRACLRLCPPPPPPPAS